MQASRAGEGRSAARADGFVPADNAEAACDDLAAAGPAAAVDAMRRRPADAAAQCAACEALWALADGPEPSAALASLGAVELVVAALRAHADHAEVQHTCAGALANLAGAPPGRDRAGAAGGVGAALEAGRRFPGRAKVLPACRLSDPSRRVTAAAV